MGMASDLMLGLPTDAPSNIGVLQTTVAELVTIKEHQRESSAYYEC